jgi:preprotein translocase subunit SecY
MRKGYNLPDLPIFGTMLTLAAGTALQLGIADGIELHGLGDGLNFLICLSIVAGSM